MDRLRPHIFLVDGLGAVVSTLSTAFVLPALQPWIGLPREVLIALALPAAVFAAYSLTCWLVEARVAPWLAAILFANLAYCMVVVVVIAHFVDQITPWGAVYFGGEVAVVGALAVLEGRVVRSTAS
ncbi:MAG: hypothetical protein KTR31_03715 [Myxococcales bacterium]|nr:hypothetical protein [Myxococcales bacterium]